MNSKIVMLLERYKTLLQVLGLYVFLIFKYFCVEIFCTSLLSAKYGAAILVCLQEHQHSGRTIVQTSLELTFGYIAATDYLI